MSLVTNHLKLAKQSQTYEVLTPTLLKKTFVEKTLLREKKTIQTVFRHFQEVIYLLEQRLRAQRSRQVNFECMKGVQRASTIYVGKDNIKEEIPSFDIYSFFFFFIQRRGKALKFNFALSES